VSAANNGERDVVLACWAAVSGCAGVGRCGYNADSMSVIGCSPDAAGSCGESVQQSCQTSVVVVLDDISLSSLHALQLQQSR